MQRPQQRVGAFGRDDAGVHSKVAGVHIQLFCWIERKTIRRTGGILELANLNARSRLQRDLSRNQIVLVRRVRVDVIAAQGVEVQRNCCLLPCRDDGRVGAIGDEGFPLGRAEICLSMDDVRQTREHKNR